MRSPSQPSPRGIFQGVDSRFPLTLNQRAKRDRPGGREAGFGVLLLALSGAPEAVSMNLAARAGKPGTIAPLPAI